MPKNPVSGQGSTPLPASPSHELIRTARVFSVLSMTYHHRWNSAMLADEHEAESAMRLWAEQLRPFSDAQVESALSLALKRHPSWPPTLGEFLQLLRGDGDVIRHAREFVRPVLPQPPMSEEASAAVRAMMAKTRAWLASAQDADDLEGL